MTTPRNRLSVPLLLTPLLLAASALLAPPAQAAPSDRLTEDAERVRVVQKAVEHVDVDLDRCSATEVGDGAVDVACRRRGMAFLDYEFKVPREALDVRGKVRRQILADSPGRYARADTLRTGRARHKIVVSVAHGTHVRIRGVRLRYDLPTAYDERPCVTKGEWAAINAYRSGTGGNKRQVAAVFDTRGEREEISRWHDGFRYEVRSYPRCGTDRLARITFHRYSGQPGWHSYWG